MKMKTMSMLVGLLLVMLQLSNAQYYGWKRGNADQFAYVNEDKKTVLMSNQGWKTNIKRMIPSISYHDFNANENKGRVAIKLLGPTKDVCVLTDPHTGFDETVAELKRRAGAKTVAVPGKPKKSFKLEKLTTELRTESVELGKFCRGLDTYNLVPIADATPYMYPWWGWWWWRTWCIWIEFPILLDQQLHDLMKDIGNGF